MADGELSTLVCNYCSGGYWLLCDVKSVLESFVRWV